MRRLTTNVLLLVVLALVVSRPMGSSNINPANQYHNIFTMTGQVTVANTGAETSIIGAGVGTDTVPANTLQVGSTFHFRLWGIHSATANPNVTVRVKLNGATIVTSGAVATGNSTNQLFAIEVYATILTIGAGGTMFIQGEYMEYDTPNANVYSMTTTTATSINTTIDQVVDCTYQWGTAALANSVTSTIASLEQIR